MGIQKIHYQYSRRNKVSLSGSGSALKRNDPAVGMDSGEDSDGGEAVEPSCELGMVEGQICSIPYELYDLPDLKDILSLDSWNSCLTEEERFSLTAYLPDMDQQTFYLTLKELFDGSNMNFGNPLDIFFRRMKEGFYPPKVTCFREGLQFLERKRYYHSLRSYHDRMVKMFVDMRCLWDQCESNLGVEERISMWRKKRNQRCINMLDLNKFPKDEHTPSEELLLHTQGVVSAKSKRAKDIFPSLSANGTNFIAPSGRAKGVLKVKATGNGSLQSPNPKMFTSDILVQPQSVPRGVLKIVPKVPSVRLEQSELRSWGPQPTLLARSQGLQDGKFSTFPASLQSGDAKSLYESTFQRQHIDGGRVYSTLGHPLCVLNQQENTIRAIKHSDSSTRKMKMEMASSLDDTGISVLGKHKLFGSELGRGADKEYESMNPIGARRFPFSGENLRSDVVGGISDFSLKSLESLPFGIKYHMGEHVANYPGISQVVPRNSDVRIGKQEKLVSSSSDHMKGNETALPLTYKRRKTPAKLNSLDIEKPLTAEADLKHLIAKESNQHHLAESAKVLKIKLMGWKDMPLNKEP